MFKVYQNSSSKLFKYRHNFINFNIYYWHAKIRFSTFKILLNSSTTISL